MNTLQTQALSKSIGAAVLLPLLAASVALHAEEKKAATGATAHVKGPSQEHHRATDPFPGHSHSTIREPKIPADRTFGRHDETSKRHGSEIAETHGTGGAQHTRIERPDHIFAANRGRHGEVERPYSFHHHEFVRRTYYEGGVPHERFFRPYVYRGVEIHLYVPPRYYTPTFYGWLDVPWMEPVHYRWAWVGSPWYEHYGVYFTPFPAYANSSLWLTDYLIAASLERAYQEQLAQLLLYFRRQLAPRSAPPRGRPLHLPGPPQIIRISFRHRLPEEIARAASIISENGLKIRKQSADQNATNAANYKVGDWVGQTDTMQERSPPTSSNFHEVPIGLVEPGHIIGQHRRRRQR